MKFYKSENIQREGGFCTEGLGIRIYMRKKPLIASDMKIN